MNIVLTALGNIAFWLLRIIDVKTDLMKTKSPFMWTKFIEDNVLNFIYSVVTTVALFLILNPDQITAHLSEIKFQYVWAFNSVRVAFFLAGYCTPSIINRISSIFEK